MFAKNHDQQQNEMAAYTCPTSPWTEPFQSASGQNQQSQPAAFDSDAFKSDDQRPTHDALSDIYNRGYE